MHIVVAGSTGATGHLVLGNLIEHNIKNAITLINRRLQHIPKPANENASDITQLCQPFKYLHQLELNSSIDVAICCLGTTIKKAGGEKEFAEVDLKAVVTFAEFAKTHGCKRFIVMSSVGANADSRQFYLKIKGLMENEITSMGFIETYILRPSLLLGQRNESRLAENLAQRLSPVFSPLLVGPAKRYRPIKMTQVANAICKLALKPMSDHKQKPIILGSEDIESLGK